MWNPNSKRNLMQGVIFLLLFCGHVTFSMKLVSPSINDLELNKRLLNLNIIANKATNSVKKIKSGI